jgi:cytochrome c2
VHSMSSPEVCSCAFVRTRATLDAFLADPYDVVPGTAMGMSPLADPGARRDVIDYLQRYGRIEK